jgi:hypothetical protein
MHNFGYSAYRFSRMVLPGVVKNISSAVLFIFMNCKENRLRIVRLLSAGLFARQRQLKKATSQVWCLIDVKPAHCFFKYSVLQLAFRKRLCSNGLSENMMNLWGLLKFPNSIFYI